MEAKDFLIKSYIGFPSGTHLHNSVTQACRWVVKSRPGPWSLMGPGSEGTLKGMLSCLYL